MKKEIKFVIGFVLLLVSQVNAQKDICEGKTKKECVQLTVNDYIVNNIDSNLARCSGEEIESTMKKQYIKLKGKKCLKTGTYRSFVMFDIDEKGKVAEVLVKSKYNHVSSEINRIMAHVPEVDPIYEDGHPVSFKFALPIVLKYR